MKRKLKLLNFLIKEIEKIVLGKNDESSRLLF